MTQYKLTLCIEHRTDDRHVTRRTNHRRLIVQGIDTAPLAKFQAEHRGRSIGVSYIKMETSDG